MPFNNDIAGGNGALVRNQLISPNYVAGVSGWRIGKDGSVEFNNGTFRGSITSGNPAAQHIVINNIGGTGDAVDVYDATNSLVYSIDANGAATSYYRGGGVIANTRLYVGGAEMIFDRIGGGGTPSSFFYIPDTGAGGQSADVKLQVASYGVGETLVLDFLSGAFNGALPATLVMTARGVSGSVMQSDQTRTNNLVHAGLYSSNTIDGIGDVVINHGASFTPTVGHLTAWDFNNTGVMYQCSWWQNPFTSTQMKFFIRTISGGTPPVNTPVGVMAILLG